MAYLDGNIVDNTLINPQKHKFIGLFRTPNPPYSDGSWDVYACPCGTHLWTREGVFNHWQLGHMDTPQYKTIEDE